MDEWCLGVEVVLVWCMSARVVHECLSVVRACARACVGNVWVVFV